MGVFFIDTATGHVASARQLHAAGMLGRDGVPPRPWHRIQGSGDASTMWYAILRREMRGVFIGALAIRHGEHHASLLADGWQEVAVEEVGAELDLENAAVADAASGDEDGGA